MAVERITSSNEQSIGSTTKGDERKGMSSNIAANTIQVLVEAITLRAGQIGESKRSRHYPYRTIEDGTPDGAPDH